MGDKEDYLTQYRVFFENFAATVNPEDQLPVNIAGYTITEAEVPGEVLYWTTQYLTEKQCPQTLLTPLRRIILDEVRVASKKAPNEFGYKSDESVYVALRLMQAVTARVNAICLRYLDNSRLDTLPPPPPLSQRDMKTVSCATKNSRRAMEDRHVEIGNLEALFGIETTEPTSFYAVYDGHAGSAAATYCAAHLHQYLVESPDFKTDLKRAMREAFLRTDAEFIRKSNQERANGGSTAVAIAVRGRQLLAAWAGDSLALLAKRMRLLQLVRPHKPSREDERNRIESSGGTVLFWGTWRVNGQLAVSRAIGDAQYKPFVTARPETSIVDLDGDEDFVVVACDGLWDFVSEDDVALAVYRQLLADPDDLKAVTKRLIVQAKRQGSADNISIIVVFLKDPRDIAADNCPPMDLGLENSVPNARPFAMEAEACKLQPDGLSGESVGGAGADNGVDNSDSDSEDLGPETAVDVDDLDADVRLSGPAAPTPPAHTNEFEIGAEMRVEEGHVDGALVDNVAESGEESEDEWNYFKGEGEREEHNPSEEQDEPLRSETPCQDNSAWETSSVDMNSSPLNPDAPVFVPGSVAGSDVLLAESPRKPLPMDDIELPDVAQFETEAVVRPAELLDLDNCDQLNGHHNVSLDEVKEQLNGNNKYNMDSVGFGFSVGTEPDKVTDTGLIHDFERIQKDTTDFCNIQVFQAHTETNPFASEDNDELLERLKNKERDPMNMSFYQEKDDDTCERLVKNDPDDLNAVQQLPDSDDDDIQPNGVYDSVIENDKENINPEQHTDLLGAVGDIPEPNNDIIMFDERKDSVPNNAPLNFGQGDNFMDYNVNSSSNMQGYSNIEFESSNVPQDTVAHTDTPESHKLLFEQIPEIPDGKSSELGFSTEDLLDQTESEKDARVLTPQEELSQDIDMESKNEDSPCIEGQELMSKAEEDQHVQSQILEDNINDDIIPEPELLDEEINLVSTDRLQASPLPTDDRLAEVISPEVTHNIENSVKVDIHQSFEEKPIFNTDIVLQEDDNEKNTEDHIPPAETSRETPDIKIEEPVVNDAELTETCSVPSESPLPAESPLPSHSPAPSEPHVEAELDAYTESPAPAKSPLLSVEQADESAVSPEPAISPERSQSPAATPEPVQPTPSPRPLTPEVEHEPPADSLQPAPSPLPADVPLPRESPPPAASPLPAESSLPVDPSTQREVSPFPEELHSAEAALRPETASPLEDSALDRLAADAAPTPDIVPDARTELITDIDIGIPESRAQEICVPVTNEIALEDAVRTAATPPPTPAIDALAADAAPSFESAPVADAPIAADAAPAAAVVAAVAAVGAAAAVAAKKTPVTKKSPTTPTAKPAATKAPPKTSTAASPRTPASATKKVAPTTPSAARPATARTSTSAPKPPAPAVPKAPAAPRTSTAKPSTITARVPAKPPAPKPAATKAATPTKSAPARSASAPKATAPRPASTTAPKPASTAAPKSASTTAPKSASTAATKPASTAAPKPASRPGGPEGIHVSTRPIPGRTRPKPLTNGDVKEAKPALSRPAGRPAPRPTPRAPAAPAAPSAPTAAKPAAPKPAPRATTRPLDKQTKDLANKRITSTTKAAPPRTATTKAPPKGSAPTKVPRKPAETRPPVVANGVQSPTKPPPSPPPADNALLPDVIA